MTNRLLLGNKNGNYGFWISKPGFDVLTTGIDNMLLSTDMQAVQVFQSGIFNLPSPSSLPVAVNIPDLGFRPVVRYSAPGWSTVMQYNGNTQIVFSRVNVGLFGLPDNDPPASYLRYQILGIPLAW